MFSFRSPNDAVSGFTWMHRAKYYGFRNARCVLEIGRHLAAAFEQRHSLEAVPRRFGVRGTGWHQLPWKRHN